MGRGGETGGGGRDRDRFAATQLKTASKADSIAAQLLHHDLVLLFTFSAAVTKHGIGCGHGNSSVLRGRRQEAPSSEQVRSPCLLVATGLSVKTGENSFFFLSFLLVFGALLDTAAPAAGVCGCCPLVPSASVNKLWSKGLLRAAGGLC